MRLYKFSLFKFITLFFCVFFFAHAAYASSYYVSPDGTETWPNCTSPSNPCRASNTDRNFLNAKAGDTVYFLDGTYFGLQQSSNQSYRTPAWNPVNSGTADNFITFKALNTRKVELIGLSFKGDGTSVDGIPGEGDGTFVAVIGAHNRDYIIWDGFIVRGVNNSNNSIMAGIHLWNSKNSAIKNIDIYGVEHSLGGSSNWQGLRSESTDYTLFENCYVQGYKEISNNYNTSGFKSYNADNLIIKNCVFEDCTTGIFLKGFPHKSPLIENNWIKNNHRGIHTLESSYSANEPNIDVVVRNNLFSGNNTNFYVIDNRNKFSLRMVFHNNTFVGGKSISWTGADTGEGPTIYNNIFYTKGETNAWNLFSYNSNAAPLFAEDHNRLDFSSPIRLRLWSGPSYTSLTSWQASEELYGGGNPGANSTTADPMFVNSSGTLSQLHDFVLSSNSPLRGAGRNGANMGANISEVGVKPAPPHGLIIIY